MTQIANTSRFIKKKYAKAVFTAPQVATYMGITHGYPKASTINDVSRLFHKRAIKKEDEVNLVRKAFYVQKNGKPIFTFLYCMRGNATEMFKKVKHKPVPKGKGRGK